MQSDVWRYFKYDAVTNRSPCVTTKGENTCDNLFSGKKLTNLKNHLQSRYAEEYASCQKRGTTLKLKKRGAVTATSIYHDLTLKQNSECVGA